MAKYTPEQLREIRLRNLRQNQHKDVSGKAEMIPADISGYIYPHVINLLTAVEFIIYCDEVRGWVKDHEEWKVKEDIDDINGIAMEKVIQFRLLSEKKVKKNLDIDKEFTSSKTREQNHRNNLGAKRATRITEHKITNNTTNNVVVLAGRIDDSKLQQLRELNNREIADDDNMYPVKDALDVSLIEETQ
jgi:hypothetical protein